MARDLQTVKTRTLTAAQFEDLWAVPPERECLANLTSMKTPFGPKTETCGETDISRGICLDSADSSNLHA
jgi:hypothetical protein